jgi:hypothetical protein
MSPSYFLSVFQVAAFLQGVPTKIRNVFRVSETQNPAPVTPARTYSCPTPSNFHIHHPFYTHTFTCLLSFPDTRNLCSVKNTRPRFATIHKTCKITGLYILVVSVLETTGMVTVSNLKNNKCFQSLLFFPTSVVFLGAVLGCL